MNKREAMCAYISHLNGMKPNEVMKLSLQFDLWSSCSCKSATRAVHDIADWYFLGHTRQYWSDLRHSDLTWEQVYDTINFNPFYRQRDLP